MTQEQFKKIEEFYNREDVIEKTFGNKRLQNMYTGKVVKKNVSYINLINLTSYIILYNVT